MVILWFIVFTTYINYIMHYVKCQNKKKKALAFNFYINNTYLLSMLLDESFCIYSLFLHLEIAYKLVLMKYQSVQALFV